MSKEVLEDNIEDFENQSWCQMDKEKYDLSDFDKYFFDGFYGKDTQGYQAFLDYNKQYIQTKIDQEVKKNDEKWWTACMYNVDIESWDRIRGAKHALEAPGKNEIPIGVSQWKEIGIKYGYYEYFRREEIKKIVEEIKEEVLSAKYGTKNRVELLCKLNSYIK